jgi:predicted DNA-binding ribbon-helix-helix protein
MRTLERIAEKQGVQVDDLVAELEKARQQQPGLHTDN